MINGTATLVVLLGMTTLFSGCWFCTCKKDKSKQQPLLAQKTFTQKKELTFTKTQPRQDPAIIQATDPAITPAAAPTVTLAPAATSAPAETSTQAPAQATKPVPLEQPKNISQKTFTLITSEKEFYELIQNPSIVYFDADWCKACDQMDPLFDSVAKEFHTKYQFIRVDVDKFRALATQNYKITAIPAILFFNKGQELVSIGRLVSSSTTKNDYVQKMTLAFEKP